MKNLNDVSVLIPTWLTATHALGAYRSVRKFYPDIPIYFVSDYPTEQGVNDWHRIHAKGWDSFDTDYSKVQQLPDVAFMWRKHKGWETDGHGNAVTHAMRFIHTKWVVHLSDDVRIIKPGVIEFMLKEADRKSCGVGEDFTRDWLPNLGKWLCMFRGDLYHKYGLDFHADYEKCYDAGSPMFDALIKKGYNLKFVTLGESFVHLGSTKTHEWDKYYEFKD